MHPGAVTALLSPFTQCGILLSNHEQHTSFLMQIMQARAAKEHQDVVTYSLMDVTALQLQV